MEETGIRGYAAHGSALIPSKLISESATGRREPDGCLKSTYYQYLSEITPVVLRPSDRLRRGGGRPII
jgi:hypothetical protein